VIYQNIWNEFFYKVHSISFYFDTKDGSNLKLLVKKIKYYWKAERKRELNEAQTFAALKYFLENIEDEFTLNQLTHSVVNRRFKIINQQIFSKRKKKVETVSFKIEMPTDEEMKEIQLIKKGYDRLRNE